MNLGIHGLSGEIKEANSYYDDPFDCVGRFDFVMANPPFNVDGIDKGRLAKDKRTALVVAELFLLDNGFELIAEDGETLASVLALSEGAMSEDAFATFLRAQLGPAPTD